MSLQKFPVQKTILIEVPIPTTQSERYKFADTDNTLQGKSVTGIILHTPDVVKTPEGKEVVPINIQKKAFITLTSKKTGVEEIKKLPLEVLLNNSQAWILELDNFPIDLSKSFITLNDRTDLTTDMAFLVTFLYNDKA